MATRAGQTDIIAARPAHTWWNFTVLGADIAFFMLGLSISSSYTLLPLFTAQLNASNVVVALIPAVRALGLYGPPLLVASLVERRRHALPYILVMTVLERVPYLVLAAATLLLARGHNAALLAIMFVMIFVALLGGGLTYPAWLDMIARAIPGAWLGRFFGFWTGAGNLVGIGGAALAAALLAGVAWPFNFALCFALTFAAMVISFVLLSLGREPPRAQHIITLPEHNGVGGGATPGIEAWMSARRAELREQWRLVRADGGLRRLLLSNGLAGIATMAGALFAVAALKQGGLSDAEVGAENTVLFVGMTAANILWGTIGDRFGHKAVLVGSALAAAASALLALGAHGFWAYALVFALFGVNVAGANLAGLTFIAEFGPAVRRPTYVALASVAYAPFVIGAPLLGGVLADHWGYAPVFWLSGVAGLLALVAYQFWVPDPRKRARAEA